MTISSAIATLIPTLASSMSSTPLPSLGSRQQRKVQKHTHCSKLRRKRRLTLGG
jgi:hypothetical protein